MRLLFPQMMTLQLVRGKKLLIVTAGNCDQTKDVKCKYLDHSTVYNERTWGVSQISSNYAV